MQVTIDWVAKSNSSISSKDILRTKVDNHFLDFFFVFKFLLAIGFTGASFPDFLAITRALARKFFWATSSAFFLITAANGFSCSIVLIFFSGLVLTTALETFLFGARSTDRIASDLRRADKSVLAILGWGKFHPFFVAEGFLHVP